MLFKSFLSYLFVYQVKPLQITDHVPKRPKRGFLGKNA
jgi:hypothetical protein